MALNYDWSFNARPSQVLPPGDWYTWMLMSGRGFGKTRTGAETIKAWHGQGFSRFLLVADDAKDARDIMIEGESGLLSVYPDGQKPKYIASQAKVVWPDGATATLYSANDPQSLRGPQGEKAWCDELGKWRYQQEAWDMLQFGMRLGTQPQTVVTTTPVPTPVIKQLVAEAKDSDYVIIQTGYTHENLGNLAPAFARQIMKYEGTRLGRQELYAELLEDVPGALWTLAMVDSCRVNPDVLPNFIRVVMAIDPGVSVTKNSNETGIIVVGSWHNHLTNTIDCVVLDDLSGVYSPETWANRASSGSRRWGVDRVVGETNQGGDLIEANLRQVNKNLPFRGVHAKRGKYLRAEPVATLYEQGRVTHAGMFPELESQMTEWVAGEDSPDRLDALVHAITDLVLGIQPALAVIAKPTLGIIRAQSPICIDRPNIRESFPQVHRSRL